MTRAQKVETDREREGGKNREEKKCCVAVVAVPPPGRARGSPKRHVCGATLDLFLSFHKDRGPKLTSLTMMDTYFMSADRNHDAMLLPTTAPPSTGQRAAGRPYEGAAFVFIKGVWSPSPPRFLYAGAARSSPPPH